MVRPIFVDEEEEKIKEKIDKVVSEKLEELDKNLIKSKIEKIKEITSKTINKNKESENITNVCPSCEHKLEIHGTTAECTGPECGKKYLLTEKAKDQKKEYICATCGYTMTKKELDTIKDKTCPYCEVGTKVINIDWDGIHKIIKSKK